MNEYIQAYYESKAIYYEGKAERQCNVSMTKYGKYESDGL